SLTEQFTNRSIQKKYVLLSEREPPKSPLLVKSIIARSGAKYRSETSLKGAEAETRFRLLGPRELRFPSNLARTAGALKPCYEIRAVPLTGRTHQIRVHAAEHGFPVLGDDLYGGSPWPRLCLHAAELRLNHPVTGEEL